MPRAQDSQSATLPPAIHDVPFPWARRLYRVRLAPQRCAAVIDMLMPPEMPEQVVLSLLAASFGSSFITAAFGIGGGALLLAIMASLMPPAALIPVHGIVQAGSNLGRALMMMPHTFWPAVPAFVGGSMIGAVAGGALVIRIPPAWVQIGIGVFIVWSVLAKPPRGIRDWPLATGVVSSFLTMFFGATGVFVATFTKSLALGRHAHVATHAVLMTVQHGIKTVTFGLFGFAFGPWIGLITGMMVAGLAGTLVGGLVLHRMGDVRFRRVLDAILLVIAVRLVIAGVMELRTEGGAG